MTNGIWSGRYLPVTIANLTIVAIAAFDGLAVVAALPGIAEDLGHLDLLPWVITAYLATSAVAMVMAGPIIDAIGVQRTFRLTGLWFFGASVAAAAAPTMAVLIGARLLQGLGGGLVIAVALAAVGLAYPSELRPSAFAANSVVWGTMGFGGPALAGALLVLGDWRLVFLVQLPLSALALAVGWKALPSTRDRPASIVMDWLGVALLTLLTVASLLAVSNIGIRWGRSAVAIGVALVAAGGYWWHSGRVDVPVLARRHLTRFPLRWIHLTSGLVLVAGLSINNYLPLYVLVSRGRSEGLAAFSLVFFTVGWTVGSVVFSRLLGGWRDADVILMGALIAVPSSALIAVVLAVEWPLIALFGAFGALGSAVGFVSTPGLNLLQSSSDAGEMGRTNSAHQFVRTLCITYGVAIGGAIVLMAVDRGVGDPEVVREVLAGNDVRLGPVAADAVSTGMVWATIASVIAGIACVGVAWSLSRRTPIRREVFEIS